MTQWGIVKGKKLYSKVLRILVQGKKDFLVLSKDRNKNPMNYRNMPPTFNESHKVSRKI